MGLGMEPPAPDIMSRPPHDVKVGIFTLEVFLDMVSLIGNSFVLHDLTLLK